MVNLVLIIKINPLFYYFIFKAVVCDQGSNLVRLFSQIYDDQSIGINDDNNEEVEVLLDKNQINEKDVDEYFDVDGNTIEKAESEIRQIKKFKRRHRVIRRN
jgi:hypothetical protein